MLTLGSASPMWMSFKCGRDSRRLFASLWSTSRQHIMWRSFAQADQYFFTALHAASMTQEECDPHVDRRAVVRWLVTECKLDPFAAVCAAMLPDLNRLKTPLMSRPCCMYCMQGGCNGMLPIHVAAYYGVLPVVEFFVSECAVDLTTLVRS